MAGTGCGLAYLTGAMLVFASPVFLAPMPDQYSRGVDWLSRYGYLPPPDPRTGQLQTKEGIEKAIRVMQRFGGLQETGKLDSNTLALMSTPRCSLPDIVGGEDMRKRRRRRRYALSGLRWDKTDLTWSILSYPSPSLSLRPDMVDNIMTFAFRAWSDVAQLRFHFASSSEQNQADIRISFARSLHDDGYPFDGHGGTLAHAFFPGQADIAGDTHFDDEEVWSYGGGGGSTDLFTVAVHEFGHALGLSHSSSDPSIMRPYYQGAVGDMGRYSLPLDDRTAIQTLYGSQEKPPRGGATTPRLPVLPSPRATLQPDPSYQERCEGGFDAVANIRGDVFFFKGPYFWRVQRSGSLVSFAPALIRNFWMGLPPGTDKVDAVYERKTDSCIIFFIGSQFWVFQDTVALPGYPRPLSEWAMKSRDGRGVEGVEAAFVWAHNGKTYLFSGREFWRFTEREGEEVPSLEADYPRDSTLWKGVPNNPDDIISWGGGDAYFFKDNSYWVLGRGGLDQDVVTPKSIAVDWMLCPAPSPTARRPTGVLPEGGDCSCALNSASKMPNVYFSILLSLMFISFHCTHIVM